MFMIYWSISIDGQEQACSREFANDRMVDALQFTESLRTEQRQGAAIRHITMSSENPDSVGHAGVADPGPEYSWKKRR
ncbi:hypothetical protein [Undibacterium pigrum]|uniref:Uncharacterized protein n=1 Tax=Undibacterium pigrum TaxID=401470 RepID=A0A318JBN4_9BURK|nr:hypothetical protein [Undibacterium pigrum]PXX46988.1 hypothetical protein DFR42_101564 [Undibacterium pigrum]